MEILLVLFVLLVVFLESCQSKWLSRDIYKVYRKNTPAALASYKVKLKICNVPVWTLYETTDKLRAKQYLKYKIK